MSIRQLWVAVSRHLVRSLSGYHVTFAAEETPVQWCRFLVEGAATYGQVDGDEVYPIAGSPFGSHQRSDYPVSLAAAVLLPPVLPFTFFCVGLNYRNHILHAQSKGMVANFPERPEIGYRANNALIGHGHDIVRPADFKGSLEAEGELVAVIGRKIRRCSREEARDAIFGWTIGNDVSAREWQRADRTFWRAKNSDTFKPMGPYIVTGMDPMSATTRVRVNERVACEFATGAMIFDAVDYIVEIARYITLYPGDVIWMGADGTVAIDVGDTVEIEISGVGTLRNAVVAEV
jgi:2-keto-4-pentenoate hydratase/2-oxohepta-3-ene-1,7-dioic acid hydratase in catechol pathway